MANIIPQFKVTDPADYELSFQSDAVLPEQFFNERQGSRALKPVTLLMYAILIDAVRCYQVNFDARSPSKKQQYSEARGWLFHNEDKGPFSFRKVCGELEIDPDHVRCGLISWKVKRLAGEKLGAIRRLASPGRRPHFATAVRRAMLRPRSPIGRETEPSRRIRLAQTLPQKVIDVFGRGTAP